MSPIVMTRRCTSRVLSSIAILCMLSLTACPNQDLSPITSCLQANFKDQIAVTNIKAVDILFVIDKSISMREEQEKIAGQIPRMVEILNTGGTTNDQVDDFPVPDEGYHFAVVSTDMGIGTDETQFNFGPCTKEGDDGILQSTIDAQAMYDHDNDAGTALVSCTQAPDEVANPSDKFISFVPDSADDPALVEDIVACRAQVGLSGCGFEQQLEATLKSITPSTAPTVFNNTGSETRGHGDGENAGFLREDSLLAVIVVSDEDDCSAADLNLFATEANGGEARVNLRCPSLDGNQNNSLHAIDRYTNGLIGLRQFKSLLVYAAIVGVPEDIETASFDTILSDNRMQEVINPNTIEGAQGNPSEDPGLVEIEPSCSNGQSRAFPPRRFVSLAKDLEEDGVSGVVVRSICNDDFTGALDAILQKISDVLKGSCITRPLVRNEENKVDCGIQLVLPDVGDITQCSEMPAGVEAEPLRIDNGRQVCEVIQLPVDESTATPTVGDGTGWFYDNFSQEAQDTCVETGARISIPDNFREIIPTGSEVRFECLLALGAEDDSPLPGNPCSSDAECKGSDFFEDSDVMVCDRSRSRCRVPCGGLDNPDGFCQSTFDNTLYKCDSEREADGKIAICVLPTCDI